MMVYLDTSVLVPMLSRKWGWCCVRESFSEIRVVDQSLDNHRIL